MLTNRDGPKWGEGIHGPDADGDMMFHGGLTSDPCYAAYVNARELYAMLHVYFSDNLPSPDEIAEAKRKMEGDS